MNVSFRKERVNVRLKARRFRHCASQVLDNTYVADFGAARMDAYGCRLSQHHDFTACFVLLHATMRLDDLIKMEDFADLDAQCARRDLFN